MNQQEFLAALENKLAALSPEDREKTCAYYAEIISDKMDDGMSEQDAVASLGDVHEIAENILKDLPMTTLISAKVNAQKGGGRTALLIILTIAGSPIWISVLAVIFAFYATLWSLIVALYAVMAGFFAAALCGVLGFIPLFIFRTVPIGLCALGAGIAFLGLAFLLMIASIYATKGIIKLTAFSWRGLKSIFIGKGGAKQ